MEFGAPRPAVACEIGDHFREQQDWETAAFWYRAALSESSIIKGTSPKGFNSLEYEGYIPALWLAVVYEKLGQREKAIEANELAGTFMPDSPQVAFNRDYFASS
jgi:hypothetical protein